MVVLWFNEIVHAESTSVLAVIILILIAFKYKETGFCLILVYTLFLGTCSDKDWGCGQKVTDTVASPHGTKIIYYLSRDCGATTAPALSLYVVPAEKQSSIDSEGYKLKSRWIILRFQRGEIRPVWLSENSLEILYDFTALYGRRGQFFKQKTKVGDLRIRYMPTKFDD